MRRWPLGDNIDNNNNAAAAAAPKVDFLDTSGSMQFPAMRRLSMTTGSAFLIVYSLDDENSFEVLKLCVSELLEARPDYKVSGARRRKRAPPLARHSAGQTVDVAIESLRFRTDAH